MTVIIKDVHPIDDMYGMRLGVPIARYYINQYFEKIANKIHGHVLEFGAPTYSAALKCSYDTITIDESDTAATLHMDICDESVVSLKRHCYDFIICTAVLQLVPDPQRAIDNMHELLKPGGALVLAEKCVSMVDPWFPSVDRWRFTPAGLRALLGHFAEVDVSAFGNLYTMCAYLAGMPAGGIHRDKLEYHDPAYPIVSIAYASSAGPLAA
jgi:SAM-dependent methyltransferase